jgi:DtxR family Mn-dependent transcriptional regulator
LGHPDHDPHGDPIPSAEGTLEVDDSFTLSQAVAGQRLRISKVRDEDAAMLDYLGERNLVPGRWLSVREVRALDGERRGGGILRPRGAAGAFDLRQERFVAFSFQKGVGRLSRLVS